MEPGTHHSEETRRKMANSYKARHLSEGIVRESSHSKGESQMIIVAAHGFAHRLTNAGVVESSEYAIHDGSVESPDYIIGGPLITLGEWIPRTADSMDLTGGDFSEIVSILQRLSDLFSDNSKRLPTVTEVAIFSPEALTSR